MNKHANFKVSAFLLVTAIVTIFCTTGGEDTFLSLNANVASSPVPPLTAFLSELSGKVQMLIQEEGIIREAELGIQIEEEDQVLTGESGRVKIDLSSGTIIRVGPYSHFTLKGTENTSYGPLTKIELAIGQLWIILKGGEIRVDTPTGTASVRGSYLHVWVELESNETNVTCLEGECSLGNDAGTVSLVAGQTASIEDSITSPVAGNMTHEDVQDWLDGNPEATLVVVPLTQTVAANEGNPAPVSQTNTPTNLPSSSPMPTLTPTPTSKELFGECGPPADWVLHTVGRGETLDSLSELYEVSITDLQHANCRGDLVVILEGENLYVPNVPIVTLSPDPENTQAPTTNLANTPQTTSTPDLISTTNPEPTWTWTPTVDASTVFEGFVGPDNLVINDLVLCENAYKITARDVDGISEVRMIYTFDGSLPIRDSALNSGQNVPLPLINTDRYGVSGYLLDTFGKPAPVGIRFRFAVLDNSGNVSYFPASDAYDLTDKVNCSNTPVNTPTTFLSHSGPSTISDVSMCSSNFQVNITEPDGVAEVKLLYNVNGTIPTWNTSVAAGDYYLMSDTGGGIYEATAVIDSSVGVSDTIYYVFAVKDAQGDIQESPVYSYTDTINCGMTSYSIVSKPILLLQSPANCTQPYAINVVDANKIVSVEVQYSLKDVFSKTDNGSFALSLASGTGYDGTWSTTYAVSTVGYTAPLQIDYTIYSTDSLGNKILLYSNYYLDNATCIP